MRGAGESVDDESLPGDADDDGAPTDIVFHDDDFTTMELVVGVLRSCFALSPTEATSSMIAVHREGTKVVKTCAAREARWRIEKARAHVRDSGMPLRITWRRATTASGAAAAEPDRDG